MAVIYTGLKIAHEDLSANGVAGGSWGFVGNGTDLTNPATTGDHGTIVVGLIASVGCWGKGGRGVAPSASLKGFNMLENTITANTLTSLAGASYSSDVAIFNQSYAFSNHNDFIIPFSLEEQYKYGVTNLQSGNGAIYIKSAGNGFVNYGSVNCTDVCYESPSNNDHRPVKLHKRLCENNKRLHKCCQYGLWWFWAL